MIEFGTDGWRAVISEEFTFENVRKVSQAAAEYFLLTENKNSQDRDHKFIAIGYDNRFLSKKYAELVAEIMAGNGIKTIISDNSTPTPMVSYAVKKKSLDGAVMVTASHNPPEFNGIKIKASYAGSADPEITKQIESYIGKNQPKILDFKEAVEKSMVLEKDLRHEYIDFVKEYLDMALINKAEFKIIVDVMYGTGNHLFDLILKDSKMSINVVNGEYNPSFGGISPEPIPENLTKTCQIVKDGNYDLGIAIDGDSDRVGAISPDGKFLTPGWILSMILLHFVKNKSLKGKVVKTISNSSLIEKIALKYGLNLQETPVGFKHICKIMQEEDVLIGGEESGGMSFKNYIPERDGILSGLLLVEMMAYTGKSILEIKKEMEAEFGSYEYSRIDINYPEEKKKPLFEILDKHPFEEILGKKVKEFKNYDGRKYICEDGSWLLFRLSGTEPKLRIYSEACSEDEVNKMLNFGKNFALTIKP